MPRTLTASAPGKLILAGEHAVVYGRPALVAAVDLRLTATLAARPGRRPATVRLEVPRLGLTEEIAWDDLRATTRAARARWEAWTRGEEPSFAAAPGGGAAHLVALALGEAADFLADDDPPSLDLAIRSELPLGSGFGSSAAAAVAVVAAYLASRDALPPGEAASSPEVRAIAHEVERRQHGMPSGVDVATVLQGGLVWAERGGDGRLAIEPFTARSPLLADLAVFDTGTPAETTGTVVAAVRQRMAAEPARFERAWDEIETATRGLRALLEEAAGEGPAGAAGDPADAATQPGGGATSRTPPAGGREGGGVAAGQPSDGVRPAAGTGQATAETRFVGGPPRPEARRAAAAGELEDPIDSPGLSAARARLIELIRACEAGLEGIGVVPPPVRELVRRIEAEGGAAKISGAGALTGQGAGSLLVAHPEPDRISSWSFLSDFTRLPVVLGGPGLQVESAEGQR